VFVLWLVPVPLGAVADPVVLLTRHDAGSTCVRAVGRGIDVVLDPPRQKAFRNRMINGFGGHNSQETKAVFLSWLAASSEKQAWHIEDDVVLFNMSWHAFSAAQAHIDADVLALPLRPGLRTGFAERGCSVCSANATLKVAWPALRLSRRLAVEARNRLLAGAIGHHELFIPTLCARLAWCRLAELDRRWLGDVRLPGPSRSRLKCCQWRNMQPGRLYHPAKCNATLGRAHLATPHPRGSFERSGSGLCDPTASSFTHRLLHCWAPLSTVLTISALLSASAMICAGCLPPRVPLAIFEAAVPRRYRGGDRILRCLGIQMSDAVELLAIVLLVTIVMGVALALLNREGLCGLLWGSVAPW